jgi:hypothetical protein
VYFVDIQPSKVDSDTCRVCAAHYTVVIHLCSKHVSQDVIVISHDRNHTSCSVPHPDERRSRNMDLIIIQIIGTSALLLGQIVMVVRSSLNGWR